MRFKKEKRIKENQNESKLAQNIANNFNAGEPDKRSFITVREFLAEYPEQISWSGKNKPKKNMGRDKIKKGLKKGRSQSG